MSRLYGCTVLRYLDFCFQRDLAFISFVFFIPTSIPARRLERRCVVHRQVGRHKRSVQWECLDLGSVLGVYTLLSYYGL
jgi:hypothetical protein